MNQFESRANQQGGTSADMAAINSKNKKYIESLKKELGEINALYDKLRNDSARELAKCRHQLSVAVK